MGPKFTTLSSRLHALLTEPARCPHFIHYELQYYLQWLIGTASVMPIIQWAGQGFPSVTTRNGFFQRIHPSSPCSDADSDWEGSSPIFSKELPLRIQMWGWVLLSMTTLKIGNIPEQEIKVSQLPQIGRLPIWYHQGLVNSTAQLKTQVPFNFFSFLAMEFILSPWPWSDYFQMATFGTIQLHFCRSHSEYEWYYFSFP